MSPEALRTIAHSLRAIADAMETLGSMSPDPSEAKDKPANHFGLVTTKELAKAVGLSSSTIIKLNALPDTPVVKYGRKCLYDVDEYTEWLRNDGPKRATENLKAELRRKHG